MRRRSHQAVSLIWPLLFPFPSSFCFADVDYNVGLQATQVAADGRSKTDSDLKIKTKRKKIKSALSVIRKCASESSKSKFLDFEKQIDPSTFMHPFCAQSLSKILDEPSNDDGSQIESIMSSDPAADILDSGRSENLTGEQKNAVRELMGKIVAQDEDPDPDVVSSDPQLLFPALTDVTTSGFPSIPIGKADNRFKEWFNRFFSRHPNLQRTPTVPAESEVPSIASFGRRGGAIQTVTFGPQPVLVVNALPRVLYKLPQGDFSVFEDSG